ncbi:MAG: hypothetical protein ABSG65_04920 [Bryobacteraceae bacterium]
MPELKKLWRNEEGQDLTEYVLLLAFVALTTAALVSGPMVSVNQICPQRCAILGVHPMPYLPSAATKLPKRLG